MNQQKDNVLDINEEFWDLTDDKVIWDGVPNIDEDLYVILLGIPIFLMLVGGFLMYFYSLELEIVLAVFPMIIFIGPIFVFSIYDYYKKWRKSKYVLLSKYLVIRAGNKLTTKGFRFTGIEDIQNKEGSKYVSIILKNKILHPFAPYRYRTNKISIGPFDNAEGVADILKDYIFNSLVDYDDIDKEAGKGFWEDSEGEIIWEGKPMLKDWMYYLLGTVVGGVGLLLVSFFLLEYFAIFTGGFYVLFLFGLILFSVVFYQFTVIRKKSFYRLGSEYLYVRAGYRLINIRFNLSEIKEVYLIEQTNKIRIILNKKIKHPFKYVRGWSDKINIGPFEDSDEVFEVIQKQVGESKGVQ